MFPVVNHKRTFQLSQPEETVNEMPQFVGRIWCDKSNIHYSDFLKYTPALIVDQMCSDWFREAVSDPGTSIAQLICFKEGFLLKKNHITCGKI